MCVCACVFLCVCLCVFVCMTRNIYDIFYSSCIRPIVSCNNISNIPNASF